MHCQTNSRKNVTGRNICGNRTAVIEAGTGKLARHYFETKFQVKENDIKQMIEKIYQADFSEPKLRFKQMFPNLKEMSIED